MASDKRTPVFYWVNLAHETWARVYLNDLPLYRSQFVGPDSRSGPANYLLVPGENELTIELLRIADHVYPENRKDAVKVQIYLVDNPEAPEGTKLERTILLDVAFPDIFDEAPEERRRYPFYYRTSFHLGLDDVETPVFDRAPAAEFDCQGTAGLREAVERLYLLLERGDYEGLLGELSLKFECDERVLRGEERQSAALKMKEWREELLAFEPKPSEPLDLSQLHFEPRRGGRVAYVTRHDGGWALDAVCSKDARRRIRTDLLMVQQGGRWRVFA